MPDAETISEPLLLDTPRKLVTIRIARLNARLTAQARRVLSETAGISLSQWRVFATIDFEGPISSVEIARKVGFDKALISRTVRSMLSEGLLSTTPDPQDHRRHVLDLTAKGRAVAERARAAMRSRQEALLGSMADDQREVLFQCFDQLEEILDQMEAAK